MLSKHGRKFFVEPLSKLVPFMRSMGITPNGLTFMGFALTVATALLLSVGLFRWGGILLAVAAMFDILDGQLARSTDQSSKFGAFLDSTIDRYSESITLLSLAYYYSDINGSRTELVLLFVAAIGSLMVSYTRARAEGLNIECKVGFAQRPERIVALILGLITGWMLPALWILAIFTNITVGQRIYEVYQRTRSGSKDRSATREKLV